MRHQGLADPYKRVHCGSFQGALLRYTAVIQEKAGAYWVRLPDCPECLASGDSIENALLNAQQALNVWALEKVNNGEKLPQPRDIVTLQKEDANTGCALADRCVFATVSLTSEVLEGSPHDRRDLNHTGM